MAQHDPKTLGADDDGDDLLVDIKRRADIFLTLNSGPTEPSYKQTGTPWLKTGGTAWPLNVWDGAQWIALGVFDTASNIFRTAVDADLDSYIGATGTDDEIEVVIGGTLRALFTGESLRLDVPLSFGSATTHMQLPSATTTGFATATDEGDMALDSTLNRPVVRVGGAVKRLAFTDDSAPSVRILSADDFSGPGTPGLPLQISAGGTAVIADTINAGGLADNTLSGEGLVEVNKGTQTATISVTSAAVVNAASAGLTLGSLTNVIDVDDANDNTILIRRPGGNGKWTAGTVQGTGGVGVSVQNDRLIIDGSNITGGGGGGGLTAAQVRVQIQQGVTVTADSGLVATNAGSGASATRNISLSLASGTSPGSMKSGGVLVVTNGTASALVDDAVTLAKIAATGTDGQVPTISGSGDSRVVIWKTPSGGGSGATTFAALTDTNISSPVSGQVPQWNGTAWGNATLSIPQKATSQDLRDDNDTHFTTPQGVERMIGNFLEGDNWDFTWDADGGQLGANLQTGEIAAEPGQSFQYNVKTNDADEDEMDAIFRPNTPIRLETDASNYVAGVIWWSAHDESNNLFSFALKSEGRSNAGTLSGTVSVTATGSRRQSLKDAKVVFYDDITEGGGIGKGARDASAGTFPLFVRFADAATVIRGSESARAVSPASLASWDMREQLRITLDGYTARTNATNMPAGSFFADTTNERLHVQPTSSDRVRLTAAFSDANDNGVGMRASAEGGSNKILSGIVNQVTGGDGTNPFNIRLATPADFAGTLGANTIIYIEGERAYDHRTTGLGDDIVTGRSLKGIDPGDTGALKLLADGSFAEFEEASQDTARKLTDAEDYMTARRTKDSMEWFFHSWADNTTFSPTTTTNNPPDNSFRGTSPNAQNQSILYIRGSTSNLALLRAALQPARGIELLNGLNILRGDITSVTEDTSLGSATNPVFQVQVQNHFGSGSLTGTGWSLAVFAEGTEELVDNLPHRGIALTAIDGQVTNSGKYLSIGTTGYLTPVDAPSGGTPYTLPAAGAALGGIKNDGDLAIDADGTPTLKDNVVDAAALANGVVPERPQTVAAYFNNNGGGSNARIINNASTRFSDSASGNKRIWAVPASGTGSFDKLTNGSAVTGAQNHACMRANSGGLYQVRMDGIGVFYCGRIDSNSGESQSAPSRLFGLEVGLQFGWKLPTSSTWSSWLDCRGNANHTASVNGSNQTIYNHENLRGAASNGTLEADNTSNNNRFASFFKTKLFANNPNNDAYYADVAPPFWLTFGIGADQLFPVTGIDYRFRFAFAAPGGAVGGNNMFIQIIYGYSEIMKAERLN